eukprot:18602-Heterococcus_DN1.PRE.1
MSPGYRFAAVVVVWLLAVQAYTESSLPACVKCTRRDSEQPPGRSSSCKLDCFCHVKCRAITVAVAVSAFTQLFLLPELWQNFVRNANSCNCRCEHRVCLALRSTHMPTNFTRPVLQRRRSSSNAGDYKADGTTDDEEPVVALATKKLQAAAIVHAKGSVDVITTFALSAVALATSAQH